MTKSNAPYECSKSHEPIWGFQQDNVAVATERKNVVEPLLRAMDESLRWFKRANKYCDSGDDVDPANWSRAVRAYNQAECCVFVAQRDVREALAVVEQAQKENRT